MAAGQTERVALMAIQPEYSRAILAGTKRVEFRKRMLASDVRTVLIYETSPTQRIVGEFTLSETYEDQPSMLWQRFRHVGGIAAEDFTDYYQGREVGVAFEVAAVRRYNEPIPLSDLDPRPAVPQSFSYLSSETLEHVRRRQRRPDAA